MHNVFLINEKLKNKENDDHEKLVQKSADVDEKDSGMCFVH